jgi:hypothetical protein
MTEKDRELPPRRLFATGCCCVFQPVPRSLPVLTVEIEA